MAASASSLAEHNPAWGGVWMGPLLGLATGALGGWLQSGIPKTSPAQAILVGGFFGLAFGILFAQRATTPGAGLIWGLAASLLLWFVIPTGVDLLRPRSAPSSIMLNDAQERFPQLVAYLVCLGMPVGVVLGIHGGLRSGRDMAKFRWGRAVVAGGVAGTISGLAFSGWEYAGGYLPLLEGLPEPQSQSIWLHFLLALLIGAIFGILFQRDVRGYGSSMGWGWSSSFFCGFLFRSLFFPSSEVSRRIGPHNREPQCSVPWSATSFMASFWERSTPSWIESGSGSSFNPIR